jgi:hypothetical protein
MRWVAVPLAQRLSNNERTHTMTYQTDTTLSPREQVRAALAGGEFEQGYGALQSASNRFCCLGVAWNDELRYTFSEIAERF